MALLEPQERVVAWADTEDSVVVATPRGLWWPHALTHRLIGWHTISKASWSEGVLTVTEADVVDDLLLVDRPPVTAVVTVPRDLPPKLRQRVELNILHSEQLAVARGSARIVARRVPGEDGLHWWARLEGGAVDDEQTRLMVAARLTRLREEWESARAAM
jgi:hypothetical protein